MKKRILGMLLVLTLVLGSAIPAMAATVISDDPAIQNAWEKYQDVKTALAGNDVDALRVAYDACEEANGALEWEDTDILTAADADYFVNLSIAVVVIEVDSLVDDFIADKNAKTAMDFIDYYTMEDMDEYYSYISPFIPDIDAIYAEAQSMMPSENVIKVYEAYMGVRAALDFLLIDEDTYVAVEAMEGVLDLYNEFSDEDMEVLAQLLGVEDGEAAYEMILFDWIDINILVGFDEVYQAYWADPNPETAQAFIEYYEAVFPENPEDAMIDGDLVRAFFLDADDTYEMALASLAEDGVTPPSEDEEEADTDVEREKAPATGDDSSMIPFATLVAATAVMIVLRRKEA